MFGYLLTVSWPQTCLIAIVTVMLAYWFVQKRKYKLPPGPMALPLIGNLLQMKKDIPLYEQVYTDWSKKYGPVVSVYFGPALVVFVNNIETALDVLVKKSTDFASRMTVPSLDTLSQGGKGITFGAYGRAWSIHKEISAKALKLHMQSEAFDKRVHLCLKNALVELGKQKEPFDPKEYINFIVGNLLTGLCFGEQQNFDDKTGNMFIEKNDKLNETLGGFIPEDLCPPIRHIYKSKPMKAIEDYMENDFAEYIERKFKDQKKTFTRDIIRHVTDSLIMARLEADINTGSTTLESLTDAYILQTIGDIYIGGTDTSQKTLRFAILHMLALPDIQTKVQEEIDRVVGRDRLPCLADRPNLSYTEAVLHESMRIFTVAPTGIPHLTTCDTEVGEYRLPKGTQVAINHWALHNDPDAWDQVNKFIPERFLDEDGKIGPKPTSWLPFSAGKRGCLGEFIAKQEICLIFASLMQKYKWRPEPGIVLDMKPAGNFFICFPKPYKVVLEVRF